MLYSKQAARDNIRNRDGKRVFYLGKGDQLTSDARDFLSRERIEILPAQIAKQERYQLLNGGYLEEKPEHMTHLNAQVLVEKTHPRIRFRGAIDTLEAELLLCQADAPEAIRQQLGEVLALARNLIRWDVLEEPAGETKLCNRDQKELRSRSHRPPEYYGQPHFMPSATDSRLLLQVNRARCLARSAELAAVEAFTDGDGNPTRVDILRALNRMSSMLYLIMVQLKSDHKE